MAIQLLRTITILFAISLLFVSPTQEAAAQEQRRLALVIGIDDYDEVPKLLKAKNDADAMGAKLQSLGFEVVKATDVGRRGMSRAVLEFEKKIEPGDLALFFFAGHGFRIEGQNYLLPADIPAAGPEEASLVQDEAFLADTLADRFRKAGAKATVLVLDACRDNPFAQEGTRSLGGSNSRGLAPMNVVQGMFVLYSAGETQTALDRLGDNDPNPNSVFTRIFLEELDRPSASMLEIAKTTRERVYKLAQKVGHNQFPSFYDQIIGDLTLNTNEGVQTAALGSQRQFEEGGTDKVLPKLILAPKSDPQPTLTTTRSNQGWNIYVNLPEAATQFGYRVGEEGEFKVAGFQQFPDPRTGRPMPNFNITLPGDQKPTDIYVSWRDARGEEAGIYKVYFDPDSALFAGQKQILDMTWTSWAQFPNNGLMYFTHLISYRCAIKQVEYKIDNGEARIWELPKCDKRDPHSVPTNAAIYTKMPKGMTSAQVRLTYFDGTQSEWKNFNVN